MEDGNEKGSQHGGGEGVVLVILSSSTSIAQSHTNGVNTFPGRSKRPLAPLYTLFAIQRMGMLSGGSKSTSG